MKEIKWICLAFTASIFCLLFSKHPFDYTITAGILLMPCMIGYLIASTFVGGLVYAIFKKRANWEKNEFSLVYSFLPASILLANSLSIYFLFQYPIWVANGGESDPIWILGLGEFHFYCSLIFGSLGGTLLIFRALRKLGDSQAKITFSKKVGKVSAIFAIVVIAIAVPSMTVYLGVSPAKKQNIPSSQITRRA